MSQKLQRIKVSFKDGETLDIHYGNIQNGRERAIITTPESVKITVMMDTVKYIFTEPS